MADEIPVSDKSRKDAKRDKPPKAVRNASEKVKKNVERGKPDPARDTVDTTPDSDPQH